MKQQEEKKVLVQVEQDKDILDKVKALLNKEWVCSVYEKKYGKASQTLLNIA